MNITATAVAVTLALVVAVAFLFFGPAIFTPFQPQTQQAPDSLTASTTMETEGQGVTLGESSQGGAQQQPQQLPTTLTVTDEVVGTGAEAKAGDTVTMNYVGSLPDGTVFDASAKHGQAFTFTLGVGQVISGWDKGIVGMKVGGKRKLIIPPDMAYGNRDLGSIPPNSTLIFEVEMVKIGS
ncbi:MAG: FKBP-type peptidyl-prolyl cis-trans isomerase [Patescibacteria group bacterium]|mgnify:CR=1 FL=1